MYMYIQDEYHSTDNTHPHFAHYSECKVGRGCILKYSVSLDYMHGAVKSLQQPHKHSHSLQLATDTELAHHYIQ